MKVNTFVPLDQRELNDVSLAIHRGSHCTFLPIKNITWIFNHVLNPTEPKVIPNQICFTGIHPGLAFCCCCFFASIIKSYSGHILCPDCTNICSHDRYYTPFVETKMIVLAMYMYTLKSLMFSPFDT